MKKMLSILTILGVSAIAGTQCANAFDWSRLNPAYWGHCPKCERKCDPCKKVKKCDPGEQLKKADPCTTGAAAPCDPCKKIVPKRTCEPCERLQDMSK